MKQNFERSINVYCRLCPVEYRGLEQVGSRNTLVERIVTNKLSFLSKTLF